MWAAHSMHRVTRSSGVVHLLLSKKARLGVDEDGVPQASFQVALHLGQVEVRAYTASASCRCEWLTAGSSAALSLAETSDQLSTRRHYPVCACIQSESEQEQHETRHEGWLARLAFPSCYHIVGRYERRKHFGRDVQMQCKLSAAIRKHAR